jgi:hypothetical protein
MSAAPVRAPRRPATPRPKPKPAPARKPAPKKKTTPAVSWPGLRLVPPPGPRRSRLRRVLAMALAGLVAVGLLGLAGLHAVLATDQVKLDRLEAQVAAERDRFAARRLQVAELEAPQRVRRAASRLGLVAPPAGGTVYLVPSDATVRAVDGRPPPEGPGLPPGPPQRAEPAPSPAPATPPMVVAEPGTPVAGATPPAAATPPAGAATTPTTPATPTTPTAPTTPATPATTPSTTAPPTPAAPAAPAAP